jgi:prepilin-type N-terminal cleavage/methylation domain-containing protein
MKPAFSLLELIFVVLLIGILAGIGASAFKPHYLIDDVNVIVSKIKQAQYEAIGFETRNFDATQIATDRGCVTLDKAGFEDAAGSRDGAYSLHVTLDRSDFTSTKLCFDTQGAPHEGDHVNNPITVRKVLKVLYGNDESDIIIEPKTGYVIIKY